MTPTSARIARVRKPTAGVGNGPEQQHVHADRQEARRQRLLDHVAGQPRVLADHDAMAMVAAVEDLAGRHADAHGDLGRHRFAVGAAAHAVGAEERAGHRSCNLSHCRRNREGLAGAGDVVNADDGGAAPGRLDRQPDRGGIAPARLGDAGQPADEALARRADQDRIAGIGQAAGAGDQGDVLLDALAEADAGIEGDALAGDRRRLAGLGALQQEAADLLDDVVVGRDRRTCPPAGRGGASARPARRAARPAASGPDRPRAPRRR